MKVNINKRAYAPLVGSLAFIALQYLSENITENITKVFEKTEVESSYVVPNELETKLDSTYKTRPIEVNQ